MPQTVTQVRCPNCRNPIQAQVQQLIDLEAEPSAKGRLLSGALNVVRCPVCGFEGQIPLPIVYHDPAKELLLTFVPMEAGLSKDDQERSVGNLIQKVLERLPAERRKAYLLQPQSVLTMQGMVDRILEADGISKEDIEDQRRKIHLFEQLLNTSEDQLEAFVSEHDDKIDDAFVQLASLALQSVGDERARETASKRLEAALAHSSFGKRLEEQQAELRKAVESLQAIGDDLTREKLLDLIVQAPNDARLVALVNLTRQGLDYTFFQQLSDKIDAAEGEEKERLESVRTRVLEVTQQIDQVQQARAADAAALLEQILQADNLDQAIKGALPRIDELFLATLQANLAAAEKAEDMAAVEKLSKVQDRLEEIVQQALPPGLRLAQEVLNTEDEAAAVSLLESSADSIDEQLLNTLLSAVGRLEESGDSAAAEHVRNLHRRAMRISMRKKMQASGADTPS
jgi:hypothetical protein